MDKEKQKLVSICLSRYQPNRGKKNTPGKKSPASPARKLKKKKKKEKTTKKKKKGKKKKGKVSKKKDKAKPKARKNALQTIRGMASNVITSVVAPDRPIARNYKKGIDTTNIELEMDEILMPKTMRVFVEQFLVGGTIILLLLSFVDAYYLNGVHRFILPFECIFITLNTENLAYSFKSTYIFFFSIYVVFVLLRVYMRMSILDSENEELNMGASGGKLLAVSIFNILAVVVLIMLIGRISVILIRLQSAPNLGNLFSQYGSITAQCRLQVDQFQRNYRCCGLNRSQEFVDVYNLYVAENKWSQVAQANLHKHGHTIKTIVPPSCCEPRLQTFCPFIILEKIDNVSNNANNNTMVGEAFFARGCLHAIREELRTIGFNIERLAMAKLSLELFMSLMHRLVTVSYTSNYELGHNPSVTRVPYFFLLIYIVAWFVVLNYACRFLKLKQLLTLIPNMSDNGESKQS